MHFGFTSSHYNGTIVLSGSNSIDNISCTAYPVTDIPVRIDNDPINIVDGYLNIKGAIPDVVDLYVNGSKIDTSIQGKFIIDDFYIGDVDKLTLSFRTVFGNTIEKTFDVNQCTKLPDGSINNIPKIQAKDIVLKVGDKFNVMSEVSGLDKEDRNITSNIVPQSVLNIQSKSNSYSSDKVTWSPIENVDGYEVYRTTSKGGTYSLRKTVTSGSTLSYTNTGLITGKTYYYKVKAYRLVNGKKIYSSYSYIVSASRNFLYQV